MAFSHIAEAVKQVITSTDNSLVVIKGRWGVGKTHFWKSLVDESSQGRSVGKGSYAYISLFGVNNLDELKNAILMATIDSDSKAGLTNKIMQYVKRTSSFVEKAIDIIPIPVAKDLAGVIANRFIFLIVKDYLICFDDIERRGDGLSIKDIMGLASQLKEQRNCSLVFIMNEGALSGKDSEEFRLFSEKVIDIELEFSPAPEDVFSYVFDQTFPRHDLIQQCCIKLDITNIRILQRIKRHLRSVERYFQFSEQEVVESIIKTLVLYSCSFYSSSKTIPSPTFLKSYKYADFLFLKKETATSEELAWHKTLSDYEVQHFDSVDEQLMVLVEKGFMDENSFVKELNTINVAAQAQQGYKYYSKVWDLYRDSFDNNEDDFVNLLEENFKSNIRYLGLSQLQETVGILRDLDRHLIANELISLFFSTHKDKLANTDKSHLMFVNEITDEMILRSLNNLWESSHDRQSIEKSLKQIGTGSWGMRDTNVLAGATSDDFYSLLKSSSLKTLHWGIRECLRLGEGNPDYKVITSNMTAALKMIASENRLNQRRVSTIFNLEIEDPPTPK